MSHQLISRNPDLKRLQDEGYEVEISHAHLLLKNVPFVDANREIKRGTLVSELTLAGELTQRPGTHIVMFVGAHPCNKDGSEIGQIRHEAVRKELGEGLITDRTFSNKPPNGYSNYYDKMTRYADIISAPARSLDDTATAKTFRLIESGEADSPFHYLDTASSRAGITAVAAKLSLGRVGIVGLGGTGSYVLDLLAKTPIKEIHLFDGDDYLQHNAFRAPGAPSVDELRAIPKKVAHFSTLYSRMHRGVIPHAHYINDADIDVLKTMDFVFLCLDNKDGIKKTVIEKLEEFGVPFIDTGMGIQLVDGALIGILRTTTSVPSMRDHIRNKGRISFAATGNDDYSQNIQIADLNALNAALAVIKWKKLLGFYLDLEKEHHSTYTVDGNILINEDQR